MFSSLKRLSFQKFRKVETLRHELNYLFWECTTRCMLDCLHCGSDCHVDSTHPDMPAEDFLMALDTIDTPGKNFIVALTGGEPLLRKDLESVGMEIRKRGMRWGMVTNAYLYNQERHQALLNAGMGALTISVDGLEESHDWLRNRQGSFALVDRAIDLAVSSHRLNFDVVTCVNQRNIKELKEIYNYLLHKGVKAWRLFTIIPIGRAKENTELNLTNSEFKAMLDFIAEHRKKGGMDVKFSCEGYVGSYEALVRDTPFFCRAGINIGSILIDGSISACPNIDRSFIQGNIYKDNFLEVWQSKFTPLRDRSWTRKGICSSCKDYRECQGNGLHNWHGNKSTPLVCHKGKIEQSN